MQYIVTYNDNISLIEQVYNPDSYTVVGGRYVILNFSDDIPFIDVDESVYPKCYGLAESQPLEYIGVTELRNVSETDLYGNGVTVGIIDDGFDIFSPALRNADGSTKFEAYYDQTTQTVLGRSEINEILSSEENENEAAGGIFADRENMLHGTMTSSIICSDVMGEFGGIAPNVSVIGVSLRQAGQEMYEHYNISTEAKAYSETDIIEGIDYIVKTAGAAPLVLLLPFESSLGAHNGTEVLEEYGDWINRQLHCAVITTAGNQAIAKGHASGRLINSLEEGGEMQEVPVLVNEDRTDTFITVVMSEGTRPVLMVESPTGEIKRVNSRRDTVNFLFERSVFQIKISAYESRSGKCLIYIRANGLTKGIWKLYLQAENRGAEVTYNCYLPIDTFSDGKIEFLSPVSEQTVTAPGNALQVCTVGCYDGPSGRIYPPSGKRTVSVKPEFCAPGVDVNAYNAITRGLTAFTGTSVSAAVTAGAAALIMQWAAVENNGPYITGTGLKQLIITGCRPMSAYVPDSQWGYGALDVFGSFEAIRQLYEAN